MITAGEADRRRSGLSWPGNSAPFKNTCKKKRGNALNDTPRKIKVKGSVVSCYVTLACLAHILTASFLPELPFISVIYKQNGFLIWK